MKQIFRALRILIFAIGVMSLSLSYRIKGQSEDIEPARSHIVTYVESRLSSKGGSNVTGWRTRYVKANGEWRLVMHGSKGAEAFSNDPANNDPTNKGDGNSLVFSKLEDGVFGKTAGSSERKMLSPSSPQELAQKFRSHQFLKNHAELVRTEEVAGLMVYVLRVEIPEYWTEVSYSPKTGITPLRTVTHFADGSEIRIEAVKVDFKDVPEDMNDDVRAMPNTGKIEGAKAPVKQ